MEILLPDEYGNSSIYKEKQLYTFKLFFHVAFKSEIFYGGSYQGKYKRVGGNENWKRSSIELPFKISADVV